MADDKAEVGSEEWARSIERPYTAAIFRTPHSPTNCCAAVYGERVQPWQCSRKPAVWYGDLGYCKQHDPAATLRRREERNARYKAESDREMRKWEEQKRLRDLNAAALAAIKEIARGHNDAQALARSVLAENGEPVDGP